MSQTIDIDDSGRKRFSTRSLLGMHVAGAALSEFVANLPMLAALLAAIAAFLAVQLGVLAVVTRQLK
jgi:predicted tellurium resistance membrane protein TerC